MLTCAAKDEQGRKLDGGDKSPQTKLECTELDLRMDSVIGTTKPTGLAAWTGSKGKRVSDFNGYRSRGHAGLFEPGTLDRAISVLTTDVYDELRRLLPRTTVPYGDLGENFLVAGPSRHDGRDLRVGTRLRLGDDAVIELTEANKPCHRLQYLKWSGAAKRAIGVDRWWNEPACPLAPTHPGGRGWLAKVVVPGRVRPGDAVTKV